LGSITPKENTGDSEERIVTQNEALSNQADRIIRMVDGKIA
jgi:hypothetical protein